MVTSGRLHEVGSASVESDAESVVRLGARARRVEGTHVELDGGEILRGRYVIDARGPNLDLEPSGYQKFVGLELALASPSRLDAPIVIDATTEQRDGFRFFYVLPIEERRVLVEETFFSDSPALDEAALTASILAYAERRGFDVESVIRVERGALPLPLTWTRARRDESPLAAGYGGGWFHPTTGYSFPVAVRLAEHIAAHFDGDLFGDAWRSLWAEQERQARFAVFLNRLLFTATAPEHRRDVLERFHRLPGEAIARFYSLSLTSFDRARILCGRPPKGVSIRRALAEVLSS